MSKFKITSLYILVLVFVLSNCSNNNRPEYISKIPQIESFTYIAIQKHNFEEAKISLTPRLFISGSNQTENFIGTPFWIEKIKDEIWVADPLKGEVLAFEKNGGFSRIIAAKGRGPGELQQPASIFYDNHHSLSTDKVSILDTGLKSIVQYTFTGEEVKRIQNEHILSEFFGNRLLAFQEDAFLVPLMNHERHLLGTINQNGDLVDSFVNRLVPLGYQPVTHNRVYFDVEFSQMTIAYAYHGLPLIFLESLDRENKTIYDFRPEMKLSEYNADLTPLPMQEMVSVRSITKDLFINENEIYFRLENEIIVFNHEEGYVDKVISLVDEEGFPMIFSDGTFFLINRFTSDIYYFEEENIQNSNM